MTIKVHQNGPQKLQWPCYFFDGTPMALSWGLEKRIFHAQCNFTAK